MLLLIFLVLLGLCVGAGGWGHPRYGYVVWSPLGILLAFLLVFWMTGHVVHV